MWWYDPMVWEHKWLYSICKIKKNFWNFWMFRYVHFHIACMHTQYSHHIICSYEIWRDAARWEGENFGGGMPHHWAGPGNFLCLLCTFIICHRGTEVSMKSTKVGEFLWGEEFLGFSHPTLQSRPQPSDRSLLHSTGSLLSVISWH